MEVILDLTHERDRLAAVFRCTFCLGDCPPTTPITEWARLEVGLTRDGRMAVWCLRHRVYVTATRVRVGALIKQAFGTADPPGQA